MNETGLKSGNDLDLEYSHTFIYSISCLYLSSFRSQTATISKKYIVFTFFFPIEKPKLQFLQKYIINGMILILILLVLRSLMAMSLGVRLMVYIYFNSFALPEHLRMLMTSIIVINS